MPEDLDCDATGDAEAFDPALCFEGPLAYVDYLYNCKPYCDQLLGALDTTLPQARVGVGQFVSAVRAFARRAATRAVSWHRRSHAPSSTANAVADDSKIGASVKRATHWAREVAITFAGGPSSQLDWRLVVIGLHMLSRPLQSPTAHLRWGFLVMHGELQPTVRADLLPPIPSLSFVPNTVTRSYGVKMKMETKMKLLLRKPMLFWPRSYTATDPQSLRDQATLARASDAKRKRQKANVFEWPQDRLHHKRHVSELVYTEGRKCTVQRIVSRRINMADPTQQMSLTELRDLSGDSLLSVWQKTMLLRSRANASQGSRRRRRSTYRGSGPKSRVRAAKAKSTDPAQIAGAVKRIITKAGAVCLGGKIVGWKSSKGFRRRPETRIPPRSYTTGLSISREDVETLFSAFLHTERQRRLLSQTVRDTMNERGLLLPPPTAEPWHCQLQHLPFVHANSGVHFDTVGLAFPEPRASMGFYRVMGLTVADAKAIVAAAGRMKGQGKAKVAAANMLPPPHSVVILAKAFIHAEWLMERRIAEANARIAAVAPGRQARRASRVEDMIQLQTTQQHVTQKTVKDAVSGFDTRKHVRRASADINDMVEHRQLHRLEEFRVKRARDGGPKSAVVMNSASLLTLNAAENDFVVRNRVSLRSFDEMLTAMPLYRTLRPSSGPTDPRPDPHPYADFEGYYHPLLRQYMTTARRQWRALPGATAALFRWSRRQLFHRLEAWKAYVRRRRKARFVMFQLLMRLGGGRVDSAFRTWMRWSVQHWAASQVQRVVRARQTMRTVHRVKPAIVAANKFKAVWRGYRVRSLVAGLRHIRIQHCITIQRVVRGMLGRIEAGRVVRQRFREGMAQIQRERQAMLDIKFLKAVITAQAFWRCCMARQHASFLHEEQGWINKGIKMQQV